MRFRCEGNKKPRTWRGFLCSPKKLVQFTVAVACAISFAVCSCVILSAVLTTRLTNRVISCASPQIPLSTRSMSTVNSLGPGFDGMLTGCPDGAGYRLADLFQAQLAIVLLGNPVALAGGVFQFLAVHDLHCATGVLDELILLQNTSCQAHTGPICP